MTKLPEKQSKTRKALKEMSDLAEIKDFRDKAQAVADYAAKAKDRTLLDNSVRDVFDATVRYGEVLHEMKQRGERQGPGGNRGNQYQVAKFQTGILPKTLKDLNTSPKLSMLAQQLYLLSPEQREEKLFLAQKKARAGIDGLARRTRMEMRADDEERVAKLIHLPGTYRALVIDPPWDYEWLSVAGRASPGYATMTEQMLFELNVAQWADDKFCHLYLWTTNNFMPVANQLMAHWGWQHRTVLTWGKMTENGKRHFGLGAYFRNSTEHVLFGTKGEHALCRTRRDDMPTYFEAVVGEHSEKSEEFYDIVRAMSHGPYGEIFQRTPRPDFANCYGIPANLAPRAEQVEAAE